MKTFLIALVIFVALLVSTVVLRDAMPESVLYSISLAATFFSLMWLAIVSFVKASV